MSCSSISCPSISCPSISLSTPGSISCCSPSIVDESLYSSIPSGTISDASEYSSFISSLSNSFRIPDSNVSSMGLVCNSLLFSPKDISSVFVSSSYGTSSGGISSIDAVDSSGVSSLGGNPSISGSSSLGGDESKFSFGFISSSNSPPDCVGLLNNVKSVYCSGTFGFIYECFLSLS